MHTILTWFFNRGEPQPIADIFIFLNVKCAIFSPGYYNSFRNSGYLTFILEAEKVIDGRKLCHSFQQLPPYFQ